MPGGISAQSAAERAFNQTGFDTVERYVEKVWIVGIPAYTWWSMEAATMKNIMRQFEQLTHEANEVLNKTFDCRKVEPIYIEILNLIKENPRYHNQFVTALLSILSSGKAPWELIQFCMRELQWPEIKNSIFAELEGAKDWRVISVLNHILEVYESEWEDAIIYEIILKKIENLKAFNHKRRISIKSKN